MTLKAPVHSGASGAVSDVASTSLQGFGVVAKGLTSRYQAEQITWVQERFPRRFQLVNVATGAPVRLQTVRVRSTSGQYVRGASDAECYTAWVERVAREALAFDFDSGK